MKRFTNYLLMAGGFAVLTGIISGIAAGPALAQAIKAALIKNIDERGRVPYSAERSCDGIGGCGANFPVVPAGKRLVVEHITAELYNTDPGSISRFDLNNSGSTVGGLPVHVYASDGTYTRYAVNESLLMYVEAGGFPSVTVIGSSDIQIAAYVSGYLVDLTI